MARGRLRVYLGAAPGVGKTYAMLSEGLRRSARGTDVVVGFVEDHGRPLTRALAEDLEIIPRRSVEYRGASFTEMDVDGVLDRRPAVALVDELAHTNVPGGRNAKRWQDVEELLEAGIDIITTVNIQHLESLNDVVESITGVGQRETVPDEVVRRADQIELEDMSPEALRRRMVHGNVYPPEKIDAALTNYFRLGNLTALRELALLWVADRVDEGLARYRAEHGIQAPWQARERIVVALTGGPGGEALIRRGARVAGRTAGRDLLAVHVSLGDGISRADPSALDRQRALVESLGGSYHAVTGDDVATALLDFARGVNASQLVIGASRRGRLASVLQPWSGETIVRHSGDIDVHVVTHEQAGGAGRARPRRSLSARRTLMGWSLALVGPWLLTLALLPLGGRIGLPTDLLLFLALTVGVALVGGLRPAVAGALMASLLLNFFFTPPTGTLTIADFENALAIGVFVVIAVAVALVVDFAARRSTQAARASAEAAALSTLAGDVVRSDTGTAALLARIQESFGQEAVALVEREDSRSAWGVVAAVGEGQVPTTPQDAETSVPVDDQRSILLRGRTLDAADRRLLDALAAQAVALLDRDRLRDRAHEAERLAEVDAFRTAILAAVSHDVRTPLAGIKAGVTSLRQSDVVWTEQEHADLLATIEESADRLDALLSNLLDLSRLQAGVLSPHLDDVALTDIVARAVDAVPSDRVRIEIADDVPAVVADGGLLERVVANVVENAVRHSPPGTPVRISACAVDSTVQLQVSDSGPGVSDDDKERIFEPFQRLGDSSAAEGIGLGLAVARGFTEALGGRLDPEDTPGGGLTMLLTLPSAELRAPVRSDLPREVHRGR